MRPYEIVTIGYFVATACAAPFASVRRGRRFLGAATATGVAAAVWLIATHSSLRVREWMPLAYIAASYWIPSLVVRRPGSPRRGAFEHWLRETDAAIRPWLPVVPLSLEPLTELAYLFCYPLVPLGFFATVSKGTPADVERFWNLVLTSAYACYGTLPWLQARPPRVLEQERASCGPLRPANLFVLNLVSHGWTTFPSGHVAMSFAVAAGLSPISPPAALVALVVASGVAVGAAAGRYHYVIDVLLGVAIVAALMLVW